MRPCESGSAGVDAWGGWTASVYQGAYGHRAPKHTWLYVVGLRPGELVGLRDNGHSMRGRVGVMAMWVAERERSPLAFARFLVANARRCGYSLRSVGLRSDVGAGPVARADLHRACASMGVPGA